MLLTAATFLVILTILVLIHEFGHFAAARIIGVKVEEFGLGLPPRIFGKKIGETVYSINWLPIGGFVRLAGEDPEDVPEPGTKGFSQKNAKRLFWGRSKKERAVILCAGVFMNFLLAVTITGFLLVRGVEEPSGRVHVVTVTPGTPAAGAGLSQGDIIRTVTYYERSIPVTKPVHVTSDLINISRAFAGQELTLDVVRGSTTLTAKLTPRVNPPKGQGPMGVAISEMELHAYSLSEAPGKALSITFVRAKDMLVSLGTTLGYLVTLRKPQVEVAGPIGIAEVTGQAVKFGWGAVLEFASILSLNLAVLNILPIPALDGGRLLFVVLEKVFKRRVNPVFERNAHQIGMVILLFLIFLVSVNDIMRLARGG